MHQRAFLVASALACLAAAAPAQSFSFQIQPAQSSVQVDSALDLAMPGTVIGNYDAVNNPTGTRTLPGLFGGSGNQPVAMDITLQTDLGFQGQPSGSFEAVLDGNGAAITVSNLSLDLLGGQTAQADLTLELLFQTFRTFSPNSLFIGGIALPLPLGQATVSGLTFVQNGAAVGVVIPDPNVPGAYLVSVLVPADVTFTLDVLGQVTPVGPLPLAIPLAGSLVVGAGTAQLDLSVQQQTNQTIPDPLPGVTIDDFPMDVPTILPPGEIAHLLFNAVFGELVLDFASDIQVHAVGSAVCSVQRGCSLSPNSVGQGAVIDVLGSVSVSTNDMSVRSSNLPAFRTGAFLFGSQPKQTPFGAGTLCVGGTVYRLPPLRSDAFGVAVQSVDFQLPSPKYQALVPGSTWYFQHVYRDPAFSGAAPNTSDMVEVQFCP